ncbi:MAG: hypothetical protein ACRDJ4_00215 [Actinomycetota bacterium]
MTSLKRLAVGSAALALGLAGLAALALLVVRPGADSPQVLPPSGVPLSFDLNRPVTILVRGWLWDPKSRLSSGRLEVFPSRVNDILQARYGMTTQVYEWRWSRNPSELPAAGRAFTARARGVAAEVAPSGHCANFVGHSAGAAIVFKGGADGVPMGYMGTLGLPTAGRSKPASVMTWANFYTSSHLDDIAGWGWGKGMGADLNIDLSVPHNRLWDTEQTAAISAEEIVRSWRDCRPR